MREVGETVFRALLDAAGPSGSINVAFRIFPEHVEGDVLHSDTPLSRITGQVVTDGQTGQRPGGGPGTRPVTTAAGQDERRAAAPAPSGTIKLGQPGQRATFAEWMSVALRREGLTQEAAARQLGVSVKTVSRWVGGTTEPRMRDLRRIQEVFGALPLP